MDVAIRAFVIFLVLWFALRVSGKRAVSQLDAFELVIVIVLGDFVSQGVLQEDYSLVGAVTTVGVAVLLTVGLSAISWRFPATRSFLEGTPTVLLRRGRPDHEAMRAERIPLADLQEAARERGIRSFDDVDLIVLEPDGTYSFFQRSEPRDEDEPPERPAA